jgi:glycosyltransferase involved in cell wall biosynthesis
MLVVDQELPTFDRSSGGLRLFTLMNMAAEQAGVQCGHLLPARQREVSRLGEQESARYVAELAHHGIGSYSGNLAARLRSAVYDAILFEYFSSAEPHFDVVRTLQPDATLVIDSVDLTYKRWAALADVTGLPADRARARQVERRELAAYSRADLVLTLTGDETSELARRLPALRTFEVPNIHPLAVIQRAESSTPTVLFIGSFTHEPNVDGAKWLVREIWPRVLAAMPEARLQIVGQLPPGDLLPPDSRGIVVLGHVPSTLPYLQSAWVSVAPLRFGAGMKGKVGEALAAALPVVTTRFGAQGYKLESGVSAFVVDTAPEFAESIVSLLVSPGRRRAIGSQGHGIVKENFSREAVARRIPALLAAIRSCRPTCRPRFLPLRRLALQTSESWGRHVAWRFARRQE